MSYTSVDRVVDMLASGTSIGDFILDIFEMNALRKQQKRSLYLVIGTHIALSALAVGVSVAQTNSIKKKIEAYSGKNGHWG